MSGCAFDGDVNAFDADHFEDTAMTPPREPRTAAGRFPGRRFHTALGGRVSWYCQPEQAKAAGAPLREALERLTQKVGGDSINPNLPAGVNDYAYKLSGELAALAATAAPAPLDVEAVAAELCVNRPTCLTHRAQAQAAVDAMARLAARAAAAEDTDAQ